jgi:hypothetical protein
MTALQQGVYGLDAVNNIAGANGLACLGEGAQGIGISLDLRGFAQDR